MRGIESSPAPWHCRCGRCLSFVAPQCPLHIFATTPRNECCLPRSIPETQAPHFFAARMQSHGPDVANQACERGICNIACAMVAVPKGSVLQKGCWFFPGPGLHRPGTTSSEQTQQLWYGRCLFLLRGSRTCVLTLPRIWEHNVL